MRATESDRLEFPGANRSSLWLYSAAAAPPLRIGLLLDSPILSNVFARVIENIRASNFAGLEMLVYRKPSRTTAHKPSSPGRIARRLLDSNLRSHLFYDAYLRLDQRMKLHNHPLDVVDCSALLEGVDSIEVDPVGKKFVHRFPPEAIEQIRSKNLDVLLRFGFNILKGEILTAARYGVWSYHHGDNDFYRGGPPHFWELYEGSSLSGVILQVLTEQLDAGMVLCKSLFATKSTISVSVNRYAPYWGASDLVIRKLNQLHRYGWDHLVQTSVPAAPYQGKKKIYRTPTNTEMVRWLAPLLLKKAIERPFRKKTVLHWRIGIRLNHAPLYDVASGGGLEGFRWIESRKGHFWADPFAIEYAGKKWAFFEDYEYATQRGRIECAEISVEGNLISPTACLESPNHHYSYPYVFQDGPALYMIPEAFDSGSIDLFRCIEFPKKWAYQATLLKGKFVDTSVWQHGGLWWMMTTSADPDARSSCLLLFYAEALHCDWHFHPDNPISTDARNNRGAGRIFLAGDRLIRPSQSSAPVYGYSFTLNEVTKLSTTEYAERPLAEFTPDVVEGLRAVHTYNWIPGVEVIDGAKATPLKKV